MSSYPRSLSYYLSRLSNFSRQKLKLQTYANTTFTPNQQMVIELPVGLVDMQTFTLQGYVKSNGAGIYLPPIEMLFDSVSVEIGGVSVQGQFSNYNDLFNIFRNYQMEDKKTFRRILQLEGRQDTPTAAGTEDSASNIPFAVYNFLGFLGSVKVLDTTLMPPVKIYFRLASPSVLTKISGSATANPSFELSDVRATVDLLDIQDGIYYNMVAQRLQQAPLEIPFDNYQTVVGRLGDISGNVTNWSTSSDCLESIIATVKSATPNSYTINTSTKLSEYFTRSGAGIATSQFKVNGIPYPTNPADATIGDVFVGTAHALNVSQDVLGATDAGMNSHSVWRSAYFTHAISFTYPDGEDSHRLCGLSGRQGQLLGSWDTTGTGNLQPILWLKMKSILRVGSGRFVEVVL